MSGFSPREIGLFLRAIREDEGAAQASGVNTTLYKILVFVVTSGIAALAGAYYAPFHRHPDAEYDDPPRRWGWSSPWR